MNSKEFFGLVVRLIGLFSSLLAAWYAISTIQVLLGFDTPATARFHEYLIWALVFLAIGLYSLRGAPHILRFSYPEPQ